MTWFANPVNCRNKKHLLHCIINHGIHLVIIMMNSPGLISNSGFRVILGTLFVMQLQGVEGVNQSQLVSVDWFREFTELFICVSKETSSWVIFVPDKKHHA